MKKIDISKIPVSDCYCHDNRFKYCPYLKKVKFKSHKEMEKELGNIMNLGVPADMEDRLLGEYCELLDRFLDIQDSIKDCGINKYKHEKLTQKQIKERLKDAQRIIEEN